MSSTIELSAEPRSDVGKGASRRLRRQSGRVPGIIYGGKRDAQPITLAENELVKAMQIEAFYSQILDVQIEGGSQQAVVRDIQRHPATERVLHIDFLRVAADRAIQVSVPLHFLNEESCVGVKMGGGSISRSMTEVEINCLPKDLPEFIEIDLVDADVGSVIHLSDLNFPEGVTSVALALGESHDSPVASVLAPRGGGAAADADADSSGDEEASDAEADSSED
ncbi:MAG: 50S ribosomal protein L25/general stress protein Ctc [Pseudomonadota bacterium]